ncbi:hypothetical protein EPN15_04060 [Patescibacteria group bacterium]|nr:MAG: hypothetical protein EPN15_04060 [Patescibacteria group bacterium]
MKKKIEKYIEKYDKKISAAAIITVPIFFLETYIALPNYLYIAFEVFSWTVWVVLIVELALKWYAINGLTTKQFLKENALDLIILIMPLIRTLEFMKVLKLSKLVQHLESVITMKDAKKIISLRRLFGA